MIFRFLTVSLVAAVLASPVQAESADSVLALSTDNDLFVPTQTELSYVLRVQSSEIKAGTGNRTLAWGGLVFSKRL